MLSILSCSTKLHMGSGLHQANPAEAGAAARASQRGLHTAWA